MYFDWTAPVKARHYRPVTMILALLACWFSSAPGWAASIESVEVKRDRIVVHFDQQVVDASAFMLAGPNRIALDIGGASPGGHVDGGGPVDSVRQAPRGPDGARVVFDLSRPAIVTEGVFGRDGRDLTLELRTVDDASFARAAAEGKMSFLPPFNFGSVPPARKYEVAQAVPKAARALGLPHIYGDDDSRPLVVIDAGHGGVDPGSIAPGPNGRHEKDVALRIALAVRDELLRSGRVRVAMTREDDRFLVLQERYGIARKLKANLFISIHCDSVGSGNATGATVYTLSEVASDKESAKLAARENKADIISGIDLGGSNADISSILIDLTQRETMNSSANFARVLGREAQPLIPTKANFHRMASLMVLKAPDMPSILFEAGYISNPSDLAFIDSNAGRAKIAESMRRSVDIYFARRMASN